MGDKIVLDGELSLNIPLDGEVGLMSLIEVGIAEIRFNPDYTITFVMTDGRTFTSEPVRGADGAKGDKGDKGDAGDDYVLTEQDKQDIAGLVDAPVDDVQINGESVVADGVANIPIAKTGAGELVQLGVVKANADYGITISSTGRLGTSRATEALIKTSDSLYRPIVPANQHLSTFYGLAKAAGHDEKNSTLAVGTYTEDAKSAISNMLNGSVSVSGTTPTIVAKSGIRYVCGEVASLDFTPCAIGICDVVFTSGITPTVLTMPSTIKWANGFDPSSLDANTTYELNIMDGLGVAVGWT